MSSNTKFAHLGKPGAVFSKGFKRRLNLVLGIVDLRDKKILDVGCGEGVWLNEFARLAGRSNVLGAEYDLEQVEKLQEEGKYVVKHCPAEALEFESDQFDVVFSHEVIEHVQDDRLAISEAIRVLKPGGKLIIFCPNRGWPFEQHGMFLWGKYYWGNIPLLPWMPLLVRRHFAPHVRNYSNGEIRKVCRHPDGKIILHTRVFPGFDGLKRKLGIVGRLTASLFHLLERTPLNFFGISHFIVIEKQSAVSR